MTQAALLPPGIIVLERGWLSANNIVFAGSGATAVIDSGYATHARQTLQLLDAALAGRPLDLLLNTHLHSDHCGGNAALQDRYPGLRTLVPPGQVEAVRRWDPRALSYVPTGQVCPRFRVDGVLRPGEEMLLGERAWQVHAAPGHDPHSVVLFEPGSRTLVSADALWSNGFGVVFPELEGQDGFVEVAGTLDVIERLQPRTVIPGHGPVFQDVAAALERARKRLDGFLANPRRHAAHAAKVLLKFKLLELQCADLPSLLTWARSADLMPLLHARWFGEADLAKWLSFLADELVRAGAAKREGDMLLNA